MQTNTVRGRNRWVALGGLLLSAISLSLYFGTAPPSSVAQVQAYEVSMPILFNGFRGDANHFFGVQMYGDTRTSTKYNESARTVGAGAVRVLFAWPDSAPSNPNWSSIDRTFAIASYAHGGLELVAVMDNVPSWAAPDERGPLYLDKYDEMAEFMAQVVERYDGDGIDDAPGSPIVTYWEMYNEPDGNDSATFGPRWGNHGDLYAYMLSVVYPAMKAANPDAKVTFGGLAYDFFEDQGGPFVRQFLDDVLAAGGCDYFDVMNFHAYAVFAHTWTDNDGIGIYEKAIAVREKLAEYGCVKPTIITEAGWHSDADNAYPSSEEEQASYVPRVFVQSAAADIDLAIWWMLYDLGGGYFDNGLVTNDLVPQPKLSFHAYEFMSRLLHSATFDVRFSPEQLGNDFMEMYAFDDPLNARRIYVAWLNPFEAVETDTVQITAEQGIVYDLYGAADPIGDNDDGANDGRLTVEVTGVPVYIVIDQ